MFTTHSLSRSWRQTVTGLGLAGLLLGGPGLAQANTDALPQGTLTLIAPFSPGGPVDAIGRLLADEMAKRYDRNLIVLNKPGASGNIGAAEAAKADPDGRTVFLTTDTVLTVNPVIYGDTLPFDPQDDLRPVGTTGGISLVLVVNPDVPADTLQEFVALAREKRMHYGSGGSGAPGHLTFEAFLDAADVELDYISYKGNAPAVMAILSNEVQAGFVGISNTLPHIQAGKLRPLAVSTAERSPFLPEAPTVAESGYPDYNVRFNLYAMVPAGTPDDVAAGWESALGEIMSDPTVQERILTIGLDPVYADAATTAAQMKKDSAKWRPIVESLGLSVQ